MHKQFFCCQIVAVTFYRTRRFITVVTRGHHVSPSRPSSFKIHFSIILTSTPRSSKPSFLFQVRSQKANTYVSSSYLPHVFRLEFLAVTTLLTAADAFLSNYSFSAPLRGTHLHHCLLSKSVVIRPHAGEDESAVRPHVLCL